MQTRLLLTLLTGFLALYCTAAANMNARSTLTRRAGLVPHVNQTSIDIFPGGAGAYPRITALNDGTLLATFIDRLDPNNATRVLRVTRSSDRGASFSAPIGEIARGTGDLDNPFLLQLANGDIVAAYRNHDIVDGRETFYRLDTSVSHDGGKTWAFLSQIVGRTANPNSKNGVWEPFMRLSRKDGSLQVYYASENRDDDQDILLQTSTDNGQTWSTPITAAGDTTTGRDGMPGCANFDDGTEKLMCVFETTEGPTGKFSIKSVVSPDEGANWGTRSQVFLPANSSKNAGAPQIAATTDGNLVVSFMTDEDSPSEPPPNWTDSGVSFKIVTGPPVATGDWGHKTLVTSPQSLWPGLFAKEDGSILACVGHASEGAVCHTVTFTPS